MKRRNICAKEQWRGIKSNRKKFAKMPGIWQSEALDMRILSTSLRWLCLCTVALALPFPSRGADTPVNVVLQYHFLGAARVAENTNAATATKAFTRKPSLPFEDLVLNRLSASLATSLHFPSSAATVALLRPLLDDLVRAESMASMGGPAGKPLNYVVAVHLNSQRAQAWQENLKKAGGGRGEPLRAETFSGWQWNKGAADSFWMVPARDWMLVGKGGDLASVRSGYLQQIQKTGRPAPLPGVNFFEADVDWPQLAAWIPMSSCPLKLGRTQVALRAEKGSLHMTSKVTYGQPIVWHSQPWRTPTAMVGQPLISFATGQDVEPFLKSDETLSHLCTNPLSDQFFFWAMGQMPFQSYMAWPVNNPSNVMKELSTQALAALNPKLMALNGTQLRWNPGQAQIVWTKVSLTSPIVEPAPANEGQFLIAGLFPPTKGTEPAPKELWAQFQGRSDLVYYDWEITGARLVELRTLTQVLPILQALGVGPAQNTVDREAEARLNIEEQWLAGLTRMPGFTVTEVTKTGPNEVTVVRNSPLAFSSLEIVLLSHWLSDTPAGPINMSLLPQAKVSGPGVPH
jgi:hypothetical protein